MASRSDMIPPPPSAPAVEKLWKLNRGPRTIDARIMLQVMVEIGRDGDDEDPRTRLLMREARAALIDHFGPQIVRARLGADVPWTDEEQAQFLDGRGFPTLRYRLRDVTDPDALFRLLRDLGARVRRPTPVIVGGSLSLILDAILVHKTDDVDIVGEIPESIREQPTLVDDLAELHGLRLTHFQSRYLPRGWRERTRAIGQFGTIDARRVDPVDVLVAKLFSRRRRDWKHLLEAFDRVDRENLADRVRHTTADLRADPAALQAATEHWATLTGEKTLPT